MQKQYINKVIGKCLNYNNTTEMPLYYFAQF